MAKGPFEDGKLDRTAYRQADAQFRAVQQSLPEDALRRVAEEVVRRLAFRLPRHIDPDHQPTQEEIDRLCFALVSSDEVAGDRIIFAARRDGVPPEVIYLSYVAGAARRLGVMWEEDRLSFLEVTLASGRLYRIIRGLRQVLDATLLNDAHDRHVFFALAPDDSHTLGIEIATDLFRRRGWDVDLSVGDTLEEIVTQTEGSRYAAVVLVAQSDKHLPDIIALVLALRISQPMAHVLVAGNIVHEVAEVGTLVGADAVLPKLETAVDGLAALIDAEH